MPTETEAKAGSSEYRLTGDLASLEDPTGLTEDDNSHSSDFKFLAKQHQEPKPEPARATGGVINADAEKATSENRKLQMLKDIGNGYRVTTDAIYFVL